MSLYAQGLSIVLPAPSQKRSGGSLLRVAGDLWPADIKPIVVANILGATLGSFAASKGSTFIKSFGYGSAAVLAGAALNAIGEETHDAVTYPSSALFAAGIAAIAVGFGQVSLSLMSRRTA